MGNNGARSDREMQALIRKMKKKAMKRPGSNLQGTEEESEDMEERGARRFVDTQGSKDVLVQDASADEIFREMKRRDF